MAPTVETSSMPLPTTMHCWNVMADRHICRAAKSKRKAKGKDEAPKPVLKFRSNLMLDQSAHNTFALPHSLFSKLGKRYLIIMITFPTFALFIPLRYLFLFLVPVLPAGAVPFSSPDQPTISNTAVTSTYWLSSIQRRGTVAFGDPSFTVFRNVRDFGAVGDGRKDDTDAINNAISSGNRCGQGCDSSTVSPALVYFPPGTYLVSKPLVQLYYTQFVGDAVTVPTIKAAPSFQGVAVIDSDPYDNSGANWYTNQNNFFRQVRNFVIDLTAMPASAGTGIHWQVAQATSLQNIRFEMIKGGTDNKQQGIFMDNGSGGFMTDLVFNGGLYGAFFGGQQFTTRNLTFNDVQTAIYVNWNWLWAFKSLSINNCGIGIDMANGDTVQSVGSVLVQDSKFAGTPKAVVTTFRPGPSASNGTLVIDNVDFTGSSVAVVDTQGQVILAGGSKVSSWAQGNAYTTGNLGTAGNLGTPLNCTSAAAASASGLNVQGPLTAPSKPASLLDAQGAVVERSKPQYEAVPSSSFISVKSRGAKGDGKTDDTEAIQAVFNSVAANNVVYFDHGAYIISKTVKVPANVKITGEIWPLIMASGVAFSDQTKPVPVFQVGQPGDSGSVEMSDLIFETIGSQPGATMIEWNVAEPASQQASSGMWDVHIRIGGSAGTGLQSNTCIENPTVQAPANAACEGAFLLLHVTTKATIYLENTWFWVADHELDLVDHSKIDIYNGRGVLVESQGPVWMYGTSSEHSQLYNYQVANAKNVYMSAIQAESPYMQSNPDALSPFNPLAAFFDPTFSTCTTASCRKSWGLRIFQSSDILVYGAGLYSFFDNYDQTCLATESCQENMVAVECSTEVYIWGLSTKASTNMVTVDGQGVVPQEDNRDNFCSTIAVFEGL
ncbi:hypothetical protein MMC29_003552 [Sticta canariensis]|nr:hypothetical protein [Sticta canariensis]